MWGLIGYSCGAGDWPLISLLFSAINHQNDNKRLSYCRETHATQICVSCNVVLRITQTDRVPAWEALSETATIYSATCIFLYMHRCNRLSEHDIVMFRVTYRDHGGRTQVFGGFRWRLIDRSKNAIFTYPTGILAPPLRVIPSEFRRDLLHHKTRSLGYRVALFSRSCV